MAPDQPHAGGDRAFRRRRADTGLGAVVIHATYLINLAATDDAVYAKSLKALSATVGVGTAIGADGVVFHVGSHLGRGLEAAMHQIVPGLQVVLGERDPDGPWLLLAVYAQLVTALDDGPSDVVDMAHTLGIRSTLDAYCSVTLGSVAVNNLEMTNAYSTLAAHGMRHRATPILDITRQNGDPIAKHFSPPGDQVIDANIADEVTYALRSVVTGGTGYAAALPYPYYVYGKTGTAQDNVDAWFCGYTQELSTCVWVGYPKEQTPLLYVEGVPAVYGGTIPADIWHDYMYQAVQLYSEAGAYEMPELTGTRGPSVPVASPRPRRP